MESKTDRILSKLLEATYNSYDENVPKIKTWVKNSVLVLGILLLTSVCLVAFGISTGNNILVTFGCMIKAAVSVAGIMLILPILIAFESISKGHISGRGSIRFLATCFFTQLLIALLILWSPMSVSFKTFFTFNVASFMLATTFAIENSAAKAVPGFIFAFAVGTLFFPTWGDRLFGGIERFNEPRLVPVNRGNVSDGKVPFFVKGNPAVWYFLTPDGTYELFDHAGKHDIYGTELRPITAEIVRRLIKNQDLISPRNFVSQIASGTTPAPVAQKPYGAPPVPLPEPPPAPAPYIPSSPSVPEPAPLPASPEESAPSPGYRPEAPERAREEAPTPRYKYATLFVGDAGPDADYSQQIASWFDDGTSAAEIFQTHASSTGGKLTDTGRRQLRSLAENIVIIQCSTRPSRSDTRDRLCIYEFEMKVINTQTGEVVKTFRNPPQPAYGFTDQSARKSAITLALAVAKNNLP